jgi:hypothetical protein
VPFHQQQPKALVEDMDWGYGHWEMGNQGNNMVAVNQPVNQENGNNSLPNVVDMEEDL